MSFKYPLKPGNSRVGKELVVIYSTYKNTKKEPILLKELCGVALSNVKTRDSINKVTQCVAKKTV